MKKTVGSVQWCLRVLAVSALLGFSGYSLANSDVSNVSITHGMGGGSRIDSTTSEV